MQKQPLTSGLEVVAYIIAHVIGIVLIYVLSAAVLSRLYGTLMQAYGPLSVTAVSLAQSLIVMLLVLLLFLLLRRAMTGGMPPPR